MFLPMLVLPPPRGLCTGCRSMSEKHTEFSPSQGFVTFHGPQVPRTIPLMLWSCPCVSLQENLF